MVEGKFLLGASGLKETAYIRSMVFTEEQGVDPKVEQDDYDNFAHHLIVSEGDETVGTGRLIYKENQYLIGRIAVLTSARGKGYGDLIVRMLCSRAFNLGANEVVVHAQTHVEEFYRKIGFKKVSDIYKESGLDHITMIISESDFTQPCGGCEGDRCL